MLNPITASNLDVPGIRHGFFTREGGVSKGIYAGLNAGLGSNDDQSLVQENRRRAAEHLKADHTGVITLYQVHGATALTVTAPVDRAALPKADAVVSRTPGLAVGVLTADCTPVLFADPETKVVAAAHAGWRGAVGGILEAAVAEMVRQGANPSSIRAAVGPTISAKIYEVGPEFEAELLSLDPGNERFFVTPSPGARVHFDLPGYVAGRLNRIGIADVELCAPCTYENESRFYSYRRSQALNEGDYGRQISAIVVA
ncbi:MAG: peptidoglycan editing factor PgeF [Hyphomicrobium sp.]